jgi:transglutaminase-like putative cysteine protease
VTGASRPAPLVSVGTAVLVLIGSLHCGPRREVTYPVEKHIRYTLTLQNTSGEVLEDSEVRVFAPVRETPSQRTVAIETSHPHETIQDDLGNQILVFTLTIPPYGSKIVSIDATVALANEPNLLETPPPTGFSGAEEFIEVDHPRIQEAANAIPGSSPEEVARGIHQWVAGHIEDSGYVRENRGALVALDSRKGDCTEYMYLFAALARARGLPARGVGGFVVGDSAVVRPGEYHNWAEFYLDGTWHLADPQEGVFRERYSQYIATRLLGKGEASPMATSQRFLAFDPRLEVRMN